MVPKTDNNEIKLLVEPLDPHEQAVLEQIKQQYHVPIYAGNINENYVLNVEVSEGHVQSINLQFVPIPSIQFLREFSHITVLSIAYCGTPDIFLDLCQLTQLTFS